MSSDTLLIAATGFGLCLFAMLALLLYLRRGAGWGLARWTMAASAVVCAVWSLCGLAFAIDPSAAKWAAFRWADVVRAAAWVVFVLVLLREGGSVDPIRRADGRFVAGVSFVLLGAVGLGGLAPAPTPFEDVRSSPLSKVGLIASLGLAVAGLVCIEQLVRRMAGRQRWSIWPLTVALAGIFVFDLYLYSDAVLLGDLDELVWSAQSVVAACAAPLLGIATTRNQKWSRPLAMSHSVAFRSTVLLATAAYLLAVAALGYLVRYLGGAWGPALQIMLFVAALMVMGVLLTLGTVRSKLRVLIGKNFFKRRYDYREEWLRFSRLLAGSGRSADIYASSIQALADLVECTAGSVWIRRDDGYRQVAQWNTPAILTVEPIDSELVELMARTGWVVDLDEYRRAPSRYQGMQLPSWLVSAPNVRLVVPLVATEGLSGFLVLMSPRVEIEVDWEVLDLLKAAGSEVAVLLRQTEVNHALLEAEKFAAVNRMSTFVVHDLKNLVAQLSLMLKNADRHGDDPEFRRDMLETVRHVVGRMNHMLTQTRLDARPVQNPQAVNLAHLLNSVCVEKHSSGRRLLCTVGEPCFVIGHADRLAHVFGHVVQNAIDATAPDGNIRVTAEARPTEVVIDIVDDGLGMSTDFLQNKLFRPFQTTKESGMGIGVYQSQQYVSELGGRMTIESTQGDGTRVRIVLPVGPPPAQTVAAGLG